jgi:hypothetical protein
MSTYEPEKLLSLWQREQITHEMATGHVLQHLLLHQKAIRELTTMLDALMKQVQHLSLTTQNKETGERHI